MTRSETNRAVQSLNTARNLKIQIQKVEGLYYQCSENKGADQLRGYREADLRLCFRIYKNLVFFVFLKLSFFALLLVYVT